MFINTVTLQQCTEADIRASFPNVSFAHPFVVPEGYAVLFQAPKPEHNPVTHTVVEGTPQLTFKGHWEQTWVLQPIYQTPEQEAAALAAAAQEASLAFQASVINQVQQRLDSFARTRNYDGILSACTYASSTMPKFHSEGQYAVTARDATWAALYGILNDVGTGAVPMPSSYQEIEALLPSLEWPQ